MINHSISILAARLAKIQIKMKHFSTFYWACEAKFVLLKFFTMKLFLILVFAALSCVPVYSVNLSKVGVGHSGTSVNAAIFRNNSVVSDINNNVQYVSYYDSEGYVVLAKRSLGSDEWQTGRTPYKGNINDGHNVISIMVDGDGYLHVAFDHHNNKLNYCRSVSPGSLTLTEKLPMTGDDEELVTYPEFYKLADGDLLFVYRSGGSGRGDLVMNRYDTSSRKWERLHDVLIDGEGERNAYWQLCVDAKGTIHVSWVWRESWLVETNHDLCYACSHDGGKTWEKSSGEKYTLPINKDNAEYAWRIPQSSELINQTSMGADGDGRPYIATYWKEQGDSIPQYRLVWLDTEGEWRHCLVSDRVTPFSLSGGGTKMIPMARPRVLVDGRKAYFLFRDVERGSRVSMASTDDIESGEWQVSDLTDFSVDAWEPSIDTELWNFKRKINIYVQAAHQGDGEKTVDSEPTDVYILEL